MPPTPPIAPSPEVAARVTALNAEAFDAWRSGRLAEAEGLLQEAAMLAPGVAAVHLNLANVQMSRKRWNEATATYEAALRLAPETADAYYNLAICLTRLARIDDAVAAYRSALGLRPAHDQTVLGLAAILLEQAKAEEAAALLQDRLPSAPGDAKMRTLLGMALDDLGRPSEALSHYQAALAAAPDSIEAQTNIAITLLDLGRHDEALEACRKAGVLNPQSPDPLVNAGTIHYRRRQPERAIECYQAALALDPQNARAHFNLALALLLSGDYRRGWEEFEWRWRGVRGFTPRRLPVPPWQGESIEGRTILVHGEQGYGDMIQCARYLPLLTEMGARVVLEVPAVMARLFESMPAALRVVRAGDDVPPVACHVPIMSLPHRFGTALGTIPSRFPYLTPDPADVARWGAKVKGASGLRVGLVWAGVAIKKYDARRSIALAQMKPLLAQTGISWFSLQKGPPAGQLEEIAAPSRPTDLMHEVDDFADTAALIANLDLVVTVDTAVAHLAGAMSKPVWILSRFDGCWRWLLDRDDSPWYPTARLLRQSTPGHWDDVIARVGDALRAEAALRA